MFNLGVKKRIFALLMVVIIFLPIVSITVSAYNTLVITDRRETVVDGVKIHYSVTNRPPYFIGTCEEPVVFIYDFGSTDDFDGYLNIPSEIDGYPVVSIVAFGGSSGNGMKSNTDTGTFHMEIPDSIKFIESSAFNNFEYLESVKMPVVQSEGGYYKSVSVPSYLFQECKRLSSVVITNPEQKTYTIDPYCFSGCVNLKSISLPEGLACIREHAFEGCKFLGDIIVPGDLDRNGALTAADALLMRMYLARRIGDDRIDTIAADVNGDGKINAKDQVMIRRALMA